MTSSAWIACAGRSRWPGRGRAPSFHARALASATAPRKRSRHCSSTRSITRNAVESDGTPPNRSAWSRSAPRSARHSPPSESITARSRSTTPGSCAERRSRVAAIASESARVSPTRSATPASSALPAWATWPVPSALTCSLSTSPSRCTIRVILPGSRYECQEPAFSPPRRTLPRPGQSGARPLMQDRGKQAVGLDPGSLTSGGTNPAQYLQYLKDAGGSSTDVGHEAVRGVATTHYEGKIDLLKAAEAQPGSNRAQLRAAFDKLIAETGLRSLPVGVWADGHGLVRKVSLALSVAASGQQVKAAIQSEYYDFGSTPSISLPADSEVFDMTQQALQSLTPGRC